MNSAEIRQKPGFLPQIDAVDVTLNRSIANNTKDLPPVSGDRTIPPYLKNRTHQNSFRTTKKALQLGPRHGSGVTNGTRLFYDYNNLIYKNSNRKTKYYQTANQLNSGLYRMAEEINENTPFTHFNLDLLKNFLFDINQEMTIKVPCPTVLEICCNRFEVFFEIPKSDLFRTRKIIKDYLTQTFGIVETIVDPKGGQKSPLEKWRIKFEFNLNSEIQPIRTIIKVYEKNERIRIELSFLGQKTFLRCMQIEDFISGLRKITDDATILLQQIHEEILQNYAPSNHISEEELAAFEHGLHTLFSKPSLTSLFPTAIAQLRDHGFLFIPKPQSQNRPYSHLVRKLSQQCITEFHPAKKYAGNTLMKGKRAGGTYSLKKDWKRNFGNARKRKIKKHSKNRNGHKPNHGLGLVATLPYIQGQLSTAEQISASLHVLKQREKAKCSLLIRGPQTLNEYLRETLNPVHTPAGSTSRYPNLPMVVGGNHGLVNGSGAFSLFKGSGDSLPESEGFTGKRT